MQSLSDAPARVLSLPGTKRKKDSPVRPGDSPRIGGGGGARALPLPPVRGGSLGSNAKYSVNSLKVDEDTGEILGAKASPLVARMERFALQSAARGLLGKEWRIDKCLRLRQKHRDIQVIQSKEHKSCSYTGLQTCGSVWACPVCAAKISERRRVEIKGAMDLHKANGGAVLLMTLTNPHNRGDDLAQLLALQAKALNWFNTDKASRKIFEQMGCIGQIKATEATVGRNGWHPHYHILLFVRPGLDLEALQAALGARWIHACLKVGLKAPSIEHGLRLDGGDRAANYVSKWGLDHEMTKGHIKKSKDGQSPFDLLRAYQESGDKQAGALFVQFAHAFKGKRQLHWSPGLKKQFQVGEMSDEELANKQDDKALLLGTITLTQWRYILRKEARSLILELAEQGWDAVSRFLATVPAEPPVAVPIRHA